MTVTRGSGAVAAGPAAEVRLRLDLLRIALMLMYTAPPGKPMPPIAR